MYININVLENYIHLFTTVLIDSLLIVMSTVIHEIMGKVLTKTHGLQLKFSQHDSMNYTTVYKLIITGWSHHSLE